MMNGVQAVASRMSDEDRKTQLVAVAQDVLEHIEAERIVATQGCYVRWADNVSDQVFEEPSDGKDFQLTVKRALRKQERPCHVCAKGAAFMSYVKLYDGIYPEVIHSTNEEVSETVESIFGKDRMMLIEHCFERWDTESGEGYLDGRNSTLSDLADEWIENSREMNWDAEERLVQIMSTIIGEGGTFLGV